jgi:hypothetical protein
MSADSPSASPFDLASEGLTDPSSRFLELEVRRLEVRGVLQPVHRGAERVRPISDGRLAPSIAGRLSKPSASKPRTTLTDPVLAGPFTEDALQNLPGRPLRVFRRTHHSEPRPPEVAASLDAHTDPDARTRAAARRTAREPRVHRPVTVAPELKHRWAQARVSPIPTFSSTLDPAGARAWACC